MGGLVYLLIAGLIFLVLVGLALLIAIGASLVVLTRLGDRLSARRRRVLGVAGIVLGCLAGLAALGLAASCSPTHHKDAAFFYLGLAILLMAVILLYLSARLLSGQPLEAAQRRTARWTAVAILAIGAALIGAYPLVQLVRQGRLERHLSKRIRGHSLGVTGIAYLPGGETLLSVGHDSGELSHPRLWSLATGAEIDRREWDQAEVTALCFSGPRSLVSGRADGSIELWDVARGLRLANLDTGLKGEVSLACLGGQLASNAEGAAIAIWSLAEQRVLRSLSASGPVVALAAGPGGRTLVSAEQGGAIEAWDLAEGRVRQRIEAGAGLCALAVSEKAVAAAGHAWVKVWDLETGALRHTLAGHGDDVRALAFGAGGGILVTASEDQDRKIRIWQLGEGRLLHELEGPWYPRGLATTADGKRVVTRGALGGCQLVDLGSGELEELRGVSPSVIAMSPDGAFMASGVHRGPGLIVCDLARMRVLGSLTGHAQQIQALSVSADGAFFATGGQDGTCRLWRTETLEQTRVIWCQERVDDLALSPDGTLLASTGPERGPQLWSVTSGELLHALRGHEGQVEALAFHPDGSELATGGEDRTIRIWSPSTGEAVRILQGHGHWIGSLAYSPDGALLASGGADDAVLVWRTREQAEPARLEGHSGSVRALAFHPDSALLASGTWGGSVRLWSIPEGRQVETLIEFPQKAFELKLVHALAFRPDGAQLASGWSVSNDAILLFDGPW